MGSKLSSTKLRGCVSEGVFAESLVEGFRANGPELKSVRPKAISMKERDAWENGFDNLSFLGDMLCSVMNYTI